MIKNLGWDERPDFSQVLQSRVLKLVTALLFLKKSLGWSSFASGKHASLTLLGLQVQNSIPYMNIG
jgi:hypothetical protein